MKEAQEVESCQRKRQHEQNMGFTIFVLVVLQRAENAGKNMKKTKKQENNNQKPKSRRKHVAMEIYNPYPSVKRTVTPSRWL